MANTPSSGYLNLITGSYAYASGAIYAITGSYAPNAFSASYGWQSNYGGQSITGDQSTMIPSNPDISKRIKIPWKMYKFTDIKNNRKKSIQNGTVIAEAIRTWWNIHNPPSGDIGIGVNYYNGMAIKELDNVYLTYLNLVVDSIPVEINGQLVEKLGLLPIATFRSNTPEQIDDNDFIFNGTMKISKLDPDELVSVQIEGIEVMAGKYELKA